MDDLVRLLPFVGSTELLQTLISIAVAAVVFLYSVYLLRKEERAEQAEEESAAGLRGELRRHA